MHMITPVKITDAVLYASSLAENDTDDAPLWAAGAKTVKQRVRRPTTHRVYECQVAHTAADTAADYPENNTAGATPKWLAVRPTNLYAVFDEVMSTQSFGAGSTPEVLSWTVLPVERIDAVALFGVDAKSVRCKVSAGGVVRYDKTIETRAKNCFTWSEWFFKAISRRRDVAFKDIPSYRNATVEITVVKPGGVPKVADLQIGRAEFTGELMWGVQLRRIDYSGVKTNIFGTTEFIPRRSANIVECDVFVENEAFDDVCRVLETSKSAARAWLLDDKYGALNNFAFVQDFRVVLQDPAGSKLSIQLQQLT